VETAANFEAKGTFCAGSEELLASGIYGSNFA
jgi:hypothetical protein